MIIKFYKRDRSWYADLPDYLAAGGTEGDCLMVSGADTWLEGLSNGGDSISLEVSIDTPLVNKIDRYEHDEYGATYIAHEYNSYPYNHQLWLCPVTKFLFDEFPQTIYYQIASNKLA